MPKLQSASLEAADMFDLTSFQRTGGRRSWRSFVGAAIFVLGCAGAARAAELKFDFTSGKPQAGYTQVAPQTAYEAKRGFGFLGEPGAAGAKGSASVFAVDVEEGNYDVTIRFGDAASATSTTV